MWVQRLPHQAETILRISKEPLENLAEMADTILETYRANNFFSVSKQEQPGGSFENRILSQISELRQDIKLLKGNKFYSRNRSRSKSKDNVVSTDSKRKYCWYHFRFGKKALKFVSPCT